MENWKTRVVEHPCHQEFVSRMSPRAFDPSKTVDETDLMSCFEAARWAPSSYNNQPWRYVFARKGSQSYQLMTESLVEFNKMWCKNAPILVLICSCKYFVHNHKPSATASLDTGASYMSFILEAHKRGIITHTMEGFDKQLLSKSMNISENYTVEALMAVGYLGSLQLLPPELQAKETPSTRRALSEMVCENTFCFS